MKLPKVLHCFFFFSAFLLDDKFGQWEHYGIEKVIIKFKLIRKMMLVKSRGVPLILNLLLFLVIVLYLFFFLLQFSQCASIYGFLVSLVFWLFVVVVNVFRWWFVQTCKLAPLSKLINYVLIESRVPCPLWSRSTCKFVIGNREAVLIQHLRLSFICYAWHLQLSSKHFTNQSNGLFTEMFMKLCPTNAWFVNPVSVVPPFVCSHLAWRFACVNFE